MDYFQQHVHKQCNIYGQISYVVVCNWTVVWGMRSTESSSCTALILLFVCDKRIRTDQLFYHRSFKLRFVSLLLNEHAMSCYVTLKLIICTSAKKLSFAIYQIFRCRQFKFFAQILQRYIIFAQKSPCYRRRPRHTRNQSSKHQGLLGLPSLRGR